MHDETEHQEATQRMAFLVGVNHAHQYPGHPNANANGFSHFLRSQVCQHAIDILVEEMSKEALGAQRLEHSTVELLAKELGINHVYCDPDSGERATLGIPSYEELKAKRGIGRAVFEDDAKKLECDERALWPLREGEWLRRAELLDAARPLFVIGPNHIASFSVRLRQERYTVTVLTARWEA